MHHIILSLLLLSACGGPIPSAKLLQTNSGNSDAPYGLTPSGQFFNKKLLDPFINKDLARTASRGNDRESAHNLVIQVLEQSKIASAMQTTVFGVAKAEYHDTISNIGTQSELLSLHLDFLVIDAYGKPETDDSWTLTYTWTPTGWSKSVARLGSARDFYRNLDDWVRHQLTISSGFLSMNPGQPLLNYDSTEGDEIALVAEIAMDFAPGVAKKIVGKTLEKLLKHFTKKALNELLSSDAIRVGSSFEIENEKAKANTATFAEAGKKIWE